MKIIFPLILPVLLAVLLPFAYHHLELDADTNTDWSELPPWPVFKAGFALVQLFPKLEAAFTPPPIHAMNVANSFFTSKALYCAAKFRIADILFDGPKSIDQIAEESGTQPSRLHRVLLHLQSAGFFKQVSPGVWKNTKSSGILRSNHPNSARAMVLHLGYESYLGHTYMDESLKKEESRTAFEIFSQGEQFWEWINKPENQHVSETFNDAMVSGSAISASALIKDFPWSIYDGKTVADIGGGTGSFLAALLTEYPKMKGILFDLPPAVQHAQEVWRTRYPHLLNRVRFVGGSFFESVPEADVYFMRHIIHDWNDEESIKILETVRQQAGSGGGVLLLADIVVPPSPGVTFTKLDLQMMVMVDGLERSEDQWKKVLEPSGWVVEKVVPTRSPSSVIVAKTTRLEGPSA